MLSVIQQQLGGQPLNIVSGAADEILAVLKNETVKNPDKKKEIEKLLNPIPSHIFDQLVSIGRLIKMVVTQLGLLQQIPMMPSMMMLVSLLSLKRMKRRKNRVTSIWHKRKTRRKMMRLMGMALVQMGGGIDDEDMLEANEGMTLNVQDIDAYWLQRKISHAYEQQIDPQQSQKLAEEVLKILAEGDDREVENKLVMHLQFDQFPVIKFLLRNRSKIVWCTHLARAEDQGERKKIEEEMMGLGPDLAAILEQLNATRATAKERQKNLEKSMREEACRLKDESGGDGDRD